MHRLRGLHLFMRATILILICGGLCACLIVSIANTGWTGAGGRVSALLEPIYHVPIHRAEAIRLARSVLDTAPGVKEGIVTIDAKHVLTTELVREGMGYMTSDNVYGHADSWWISFPATLDLRNATSWTLEPITGIQYVLINAKTGQVDRLMSQTGFTGWIHALLDQGLLKGMKEFHDRLP